MAQAAEKIVQQAAECLTLCKQGQGVRQVLYNYNIPAPMKPQLQAIVLGAQKEEALLRRVFDASGLQKKLPRTFCKKQDDSMLLVLLYEALLGSRRVRGTSELTVLIKGEKANLQQCLAGLRKEGKAAAFTDKVRLPRYARVNTLIGKPGLVQKHYTDKGWKFIGDAATEDAEEAAQGDEQKGAAKPKPQGQHGSQAKVAGEVAARDVQMMLEKGTCMWDPIVDNLLVFPPGTSMHADVNVAAGRLILQDRSSCLPALALLPIPAGATVIDACAAPGNKTSHLAALVSKADKSAKKRRRGSGAGGAKDGETKKGVVHAFERDPKRENMLRRQMRKFGCGETVQVHLGDFMTAAGVLDAQAVTHILVDPSCSGSGIISQSGIVGEEEEEIGGEVKALADEQVKLVLNAMTFPSVECVVYSTCSVHREENEDVVERVLAGCAGKFALVPCLPKWPYRGLASAGEMGKMCVRASLEHGTTNGFFVARFEKVGMKGSGEKAGVGAQGVRPKGHGAAVVGSGDAKRRKVMGGKAKPVAEPAEIKGFIDVD